ncbi:MAG: homocysteine S-methyltransferase family protein, partial [Pseudomonadota bacterium]
MTDITLLDGGMGQELIRRSGQPAQPLWSTQVMIDFPDLVGQVHADYADAGATVATTNTYAIHPGGGIVVPVPGAQPVAVDGIG